jgi:hypothetical protein
VAAEVTARRWQRLIAAQPAAATVEATTFRRHWDNSMTTPVLLECSDRRRYVVKGLRPCNGSPIRNARSIVTDAVVARLGRALGAPVPAPMLVGVPEELVNGEPRLEHIAPGVWHGLEFVPNCTNREKVQHVDENRVQFARLALLYGWFSAGDHQLIYDSDAPHSVHSVDHGLFLGDGWTLETLMALQPVVPDPEICDACSFSTGELRQAADALANVSDESIAAAVASPVSSWGVTAAERLALAEVLAARRDALVDVLVHEREPWTRRREGRSPPVGNAGRPTTS